MHISNQSDNKKHKLFVMFVSLTIIENYLYKKLMCCIHFINKIKYYKNCKKFKIYNFRQLKLDACVYFGGPNSE